MTRERHFLLSCAYLSSRGNSNNNVTPYFLLIYLLSAYNENKLKTKIQQIFFLKKRLQAENLATFLGES